jgi:hypothetical protein
MMEESMCVVSSELGASKAAPGAERAAAVAGAPTVRDVGVENTASAALLLPLILSRKLIDVPRSISCQIQKATARLKNNAARQPAIFKNED